MNDLQIYKKAASLLESGEEVALITVVATTGSTPGKTGYKMLVWASAGHTEGTVGGGLTEAEMVNAARDMLSHTGSDLFQLDFAGTGDDERGICGGSVEFLVEAFDKSTLPLFRQIAAVITDGRKGILVSLIAPHKKPRKAFFENLHRIRTLDDLSLSDDAIQSIISLAAREESQKMKLPGGTEIFVETIAEQPMLFLFGAGHVACHVARFAAPLGFRITVCDERREYANTQRFPGADHIVVQSYDSVFDKICIEGNTYIVIVTRGHKCDEVVLEQALMSNAKYIGMIGSKRKTTTILRSLARKGICAEKLMKVFSPIGISIGAVTPEEIALSIVCELTKIKRLGDSADVGHMKLDFLRQAEQKDQ